MRQTGHVANMGGRETHTRFWWGNLKERQHMEDIDIDGRTVI
jgi:hypothetical protein